MATNIGKRFLKAIQRKITKPLKSRLSNDRTAGDPGVGPIPDYRSAAKRRRLFPFSRQKPNLNGEKTSAGKEHNATPSGSGQLDIAPVSEIQDQERQLPAGELAESKTLKNKENDRQRLLEATKHVLKQRKRNHKTDPIYRHTRATSTSTRLDIDSMVQLTGEGTSVTHPDSPSKPAGATKPTSQSSYIAGSHDAFIADRPQEEPDVHDSQPPVTENTGSILTDNNAVRATTNKARRKQQRLPTAERSLVIFRPQEMKCSNLIKEARGYDGRVCGVGGAAESYARAFGQEAAPRNRPFVVMGCAFNAVQGILMVRVCEIVALQYPDPERASRVSNRSNRLIPIAPNTANPNARPPQAHFGDDGLNFGNCSWIDTRKVYSVPVDLIKEGRYASVKLCKCSWEKLRETLSMGTSAEETFGIERDFKRFQRKMRAGGVGEDHTIRMADSIPQRQIERKRAEVPRPHLRRYRVEELLQYQ
ncbi:hypothetical protein H2200_001685 [Cladophialophora chaetospira]|uniref:Uncharacterized protein n=1 Tax=Cladophialophora chaetospira TaxID=386627 RepID=A0AA39CPW2_9EURO|nr:hypothetical protein H2200_001685 [Cladophialophora chaetospira]